MPTPPPRPPPPAPRPAGQAAPAASSGGGTLWIAGGLLVAGVVALNLLPAGRTLARVQPSLPPSAPPAPRPAPPASVTPKAGDAAAVARVAAALDRAKLRPGGRGGAQPFTDLDAAGLDALLETRVLAPGDRVAPAPRAEAFQAFLHDWPGVTLFGEVVARGKPAVRLTGLRATWTRVPARYRDELYAALREFGHRAVLVERPGFALLDWA